MKAQPFLFGDDLGQPARERRADAERARAAEREAIGRADESGFARGLAAGLAQARAQDASRLAQATEELAARLAHVIAETDARADALETEALLFFAALARKLAGQALAAEPLARIGEAAAEAFRHLGGVPHLAVRVHDTLVENVDAHLRAVAHERGFEGRVIVIGTDEVAPGDARIDWADGGVVARRDATEGAIAEILDRAVRT